MRVLASFWGGVGGLGLAVALSFTAAFLIALMLFGTSARRKREREVARRLLASSGTLRPEALSPPVRTGAGAWIPSGIAEAGGRIAEASGVGASLEQQLEQSGLGLRAGEFLVVSVLAAFAGGVLGAVLAPSLVVVIVIAAAAAAVPAVILRLKLKRRAERIRELLPDTLTVMASSLRAGHSFLQALDTVSKEAQEPAASEFARAVAEIRLGRAVDDALHSMSRRLGSDDFDWAVMAITIQREVGGNLAEILDTVADTIRERDRLRTQIKVLTAEGRLSALVLLALPPLVALYMTAVNREYISLLVTTRVGWVMIAVAGSLLVVGMYWMRKIVDIDV